MLKINSPTLPARNRMLGSAGFALLIMLLIHMTKTVDRNIMGVLFEPLKAEFGVSDTLLGLVAGAIFGILHAVASLVLGHLSDRMSRVKLLSAACVLWSGLTMLCGMATSFWQLALARAGVAMAEAGSAGTAVPLIAEMFPPNRRSLATGIYFLGAPFGVLVGIGLGSWIAQNYGWRAAFSLAGFPGLLLGFLLYVFVREPKRSGPDSPQPGSTGLPAQKASQEGIVTSIKVLLTNRPYLFLTLSCALASIPATAFGTWGTSFLIRSHHLSLQHAGLLTGLIGIGGNVLGTIFSGWLIDRLTTKNRAWQIRIPMLGLLLATPMGLLYFLWPADIMWQLGRLPVPTVMLFGISFAFFTGWWIAPAYSAISNLIEAERRGFATAFFGVAFSAVGMGLGPLIVGAISDLLTPVSGVDSLRYAMAIAISTTLVAVWLMRLAIQPYQLALEAIHAKD
jgi:MFS family permease